MWNLTMVLVNVKLDSLLTIYWSCSSHSILLNNSQELLEVEVTQIGYFRTPLSSEAHFLLCSILQEQGIEMDYWSLTVIESEEQTKTFLSNLVLQQLFEKTFPGTPATCLCWTLNLGETKILFFFFKSRAVWSLLPAAS